MRNGLYLGLDIGAAGVKAVVVKKSGKDFAIEAADELHTLEEGILNEKELHSSVVQWLRAKKWDKLHTVIGLPQYLSQTMLKDFPPIKSSVKLNALVAAEISQVAGLSEETLAHDYCQLNEGGGRANGFLIGLCREQTIRDRLTAYEIAELRADAIALGGMAVANAYLAQKQGEAVAEKPVLLLDLGRENAVAVIMSGKMPLYVSSLMFSGERFEQAVKSENQPGDGKRRVSLSAKSVEEINLMDEIGTSPVILAANLLESEIQGVVESWRAQEDFPVGKEPIAKVFVCGGVAKVKGLCEWLTEHLETPVEIFGPTVDGVMRPELAQAYGLALQSAEDMKAPIRLSLIPSDIRWRNLRQANWPYLAAALALLVAVFALIDICWYMRTSSLITTYTAQHDALESCGNLIGRITSAENALYEREAKIVPLVEAGCQPVRMKKALAEIARASGEGDWFVYLADEASYLQARNDNRQDNRNARSGNSDMFGGSGGNDVAGVPEFPVRLLPRETDVTTKFITASYAPLKPSEPYAPASEFAKKLNDGKIFKGVDIMQGKDSIGREDIFTSWDRWIKGVRGSFKRFSFALPFADVDVRKELLPEPSAKGKGKGKKK